MWLVDRAAAYDCLRWGEWRGMDNGPLGSLESVPTPLAKPLNWATPVWRKGCTLGIHTKVGYGLGEGSSMGSLAKVYKGNL